MYDYTHIFLFFSSRRRHTRYWRDWSSDVCSSDLAGQYAAVDENLTGFENLEMVGRLYHLPRKEARDRADELLERFELTRSEERRGGKESRSRWSPYH